MIKWFLSPDISMSRKDSLLLFSFSKVNFYIFTKNSAVRDHILVCDNIVSFEDFSILAHGTNDFRIKLQESLLIHRDGPQLNKTSESTPLVLFS